MKIHFPITTLAAGIILISCSNTINNNEPTQTSTTMNSSELKTEETIKIVIDGKTFTFKLADNKTAQELLKLAPFEGSAGVYHDNHYYLPTPKGLPTEGLKSTKDAKKGHLVYSAEYKGLGIFFADGHFDENELFYIGESEEDFSALDTKKTVKIKIER